MRKFSAIVTAFALAGATVGQFDIFPGAYLGIEIAIGFQ